MPTPAGLAEWREVADTAVDAAVASHVEGDHVLLLRAHNMVAGRWQVDDHDWLRDVSLTPPDAVSRAIAAHVLDVMVGIETAIAENRIVEIDSTFAEVEPMPADFRVT